MNYKKYLDYSPTVQGFFDSVTHTISYVVSDPATKKCVVIDSVADFDQSSGSLEYTCAQKILEYVRQRELTVEFVLETHVHADHLSAAPFVKEHLGGLLSIGEQVVTVQETFGEVFFPGDRGKRIDSFFERFFHDEEEFSLGEIPSFCLHTPGHTPADMVYGFGDALFVGDTLFMPDFGSGRCDFPGGSAEDLYLSSRKIFALPDSMRVFLCHDYLPQGRSDFQWETTVGDQKQKNVHLREGISKKEFVSLREKRDLELSLPSLIIPSLQVNMRAGYLPDPLENGVSYLNTPINSIFTKV